MLEGKSKMWIAIVLSNLFENCEDTEAGNHPGCSNRCPAPFPNVHSDHIDPALEKAGHRLPSSEYTPDHHMTPAGAVMER